MWGRETLVGMPFVLNVRASDPDLDMMMLTVSNAPRAPRSPTSAPAGAGSAGRRGRRGRQPPVTFHVADTGTPMKVGTLDVAVHGRGPG